MVKRQTFFIVLLVLSGICQAALIAALWDVATDLRADVDRLELRVITTQLKYEEARNETEHLKRDLNDANRRLAAAADREKRAAEVRASRSRAVAGSARTSEQRKSASSDVSLHDITMYCPTGNTTASGMWPRRGMVATISRSIPFGTRVRIEGLGTFVVEDRIGHGSEFDIFTPSCSEANRFGRQHRRVTILE